MHWIVDIECSYQTRFYFEGSKIRFVACLLRDGAHNWWDEVGCALGVKADEAIEVQQFAKELDLHQTTDNVVEITTKFRERAFLGPYYTTNEEMKKIRYHDM